MTSRGRLYDVRSVVEISCLLTAVGVLVKKAAAPAQVQSVHTGNRLWVQVG
jgi:hypothetical protein